MGRVKYTAEERKVIIASFIRATRAIVDAEGIEAVSIREVSHRTGYSSAMLYLYFDDIDELLAYVSVGCLEDYCQELASDAAQAPSPKDAYEHAWRLLCKRSFQRPVLFLNLFFGRHSAAIDDIVSRYFEVFPSELGRLGDAALQMLALGGIERRNLALLRPYAAELGLDDETTALVNGITVACYRSALEGFRDASLGADDIDAETDRIMRTIRFLMGCTAAASREA
jgi:AcrR family transcriptional regulator